MNRSVMDRIRKKITRKRVLLVLLCVFTAGTAYSTFYYYRDLIFGPPVLFREDDNIEIGLYPHNHQAVFAVTIDDVSALTEASRVRNVVGVLDEFGVKGVFFVIPYDRGRHRMRKGLEVSEVLRDAVRGGHEVGQHGLTHIMPRKSIRSVNWAREFRGLPYGEQRRRIFTGRRILEDAGFTVNGFRSPAFSANLATLKILESEGFLYGANVAVYPPPFMMANKRFAESIYYPFYPEGLNLVEFVAHGDYFKLLHNRKNFISLRNRFERIYSRGGVFSLYTHVQYLDDRGLELLRRCLTFADGRNVWKPNLSEAAVWWKAREPLWAGSEVREDAFIIRVEKGNELDLEGLTIRFKKNVPAQRYEIYDGIGSLIKEGLVSEGVVIMDY